MSKSQTNMYQDSIFQWNVFKGCEFECEYCKRSYQAMGRFQKPVYDEHGNVIRGCKKCYEYKPHIHWERLEDDWIQNHLPERTIDDQFIWCCSSGDISFLSKNKMQLILEKISYMPSLTFFIQTKDPEYYNNLIFPKNIILGITLETNYKTKKISKAPNPSERVKAFKEIEWNRKFITIEPILAFDLEIFNEMIKEINPERIYIGYDSKKCKLDEPSLESTRMLIRLLRMNNFYVKEKKIRKAWWEGQ